MIRALPIISLVCVAQLSTGCNIGVSAKRAASPGGAVINRCRTTHVPGDGLFDDFEDGDRQAAKVGKRGGYWWTKKDEVGSTIEFMADEPGAGGSELAMHVTGTTARGSAEAAWGAGLGVNFSPQNGELYDASKYAGISFRAKVGSPRSARAVRLKIADVNTHQDAKICKTCWNHFGKDLTLTPEWKEYRVSFSGAEQEPGWGDPRPQAVTPSKLVGLNWGVGPGNDYDIWIDDVAFLDCE